MLLLLLLFTRFYIDPSCLFIWQTIVAVFAILPKHPGFIMAPSMRSLFSGERKKKKPLMPVFVPINQAHLDIVLEYYFDVNNKLDQNGQALN